MKRVIAFGTLCAGLNGESLHAWYGGAHRESIRVTEDVADVNIVASASHSWEEGWWKLHVQAFSNVSPELAMYAAGYLEGYISKKQIEDAMNNTYADWFIDGDEGTNATAVYGWLEDNFAWTQREADHSQEQFWKHAKLVVAQLDGLVAGLHAAGSSLSVRDILLLNADGDLEELVPMLGVKKRTRRRDRCSAAFKLAADRSEIFFGHATFDHYDMMLRSLKVYDLQLQGIPRSVVSMSSSPGFLSSIDDFVLNNHGLAIIETTNGVENHSLFTDITTASALSFVRAAVANAHATSGAEWVELFSTANSGTYNNQWMILDIKRFQPGLALASGTFTVLEQMPGMIEWRDMTAHLEEHQYWGSYNVPFFTTIYQRSGNTVPDGYHTAPRARIFAARQHSVSSLEDMKSLLRYNDWQHDPLSLGNACNGISSRCDLNPLSSDIWQLDGGIDAKVTTTAMAKELNFVAQCGPTTYQQPPFDWNNVPAHRRLSHVGAPTSFNFAWVSFGPNEENSASGLSSSWPRTNGFLMIPFYAFVVVAALTIIVGAVLRWCFMPAPLSKLEQKLLVP